jgi:hypothetical protein
MKIGDKVIHTKQWNQYKGWVGTIVRFDPSVEGCVFVKWDIRIDPNGTVFKDSLESDGTIQYVLELTLYQPVSDPAAH